MNDTQAELELSRDNAPTPFEMAVRQRWPSVVKAETNPLTGGSIFSSSGSDALGGTWAGSFGLTNTVILFGDSFNERSFVGVTLSSTTATDNGDGTSTATMSTAPNATTNQIAVGDTIRVNGDSNPKNNQIAATVTAVSNSPTYSVTYTNTGPYSDLVGSLPSTVIMPNRLNTAGTFAQLCRLANADFTVVANCAQGGGNIEHSQQILERAYPNVHARFGFWLSPGTNNIYASGDSLATLQAKALAFIKAAMPHCQYFVVFTIPPMSASKTGWTLAKAQIQLQFNRWLTEVVRARGGIVIESHLAASNGVTYGSGSDTNGAPNAGFIESFTGDYTHACTVGSHALAKLCLSKISAYILPSGLWPTNALDAVYYDANSKYMLDSSHVMLSGSSGTVTAGSGTISGTAPTGVTVAWASGGAGLTAALTSTARTVAADGDAIGNNLAIALSGTASSAGASLLRVSVAATAARFNVGDVIRALARIKTTSAVGILAINVIARCGYASMSRADNASSENVDDTTKLTAGATYNEDMTVQQYSPWGPIRAVANAGALSSVTCAIDIWLIGSGYNAGAGAGVVGGTVNMAHPNIERKMAA